MIENNQITNITPSTPPVEVASQNKQKVQYREYLSKASVIFKKIFIKFYSNKKVFWSVLIPVGLVFLVILIGLIFGRKNNNTPTKKLPTPTPFVNSQTPIPVTNDVISSSSAKLNNLKNIINNLDVKESKLQPPDLDFNIKF